MKFLLVTMVSFFAFNSMAAEAPVFVRKLIDPKDESMMILACKSGEATSCRVLGGGAMDVLQVMRLKNKFVVAQNLERAATVTIFTSSIAISGFMATAFVGGFGAVPGAVLGFVGSTIYVYAFPDNLKYNGPLKVISAESNQVGTAEYTIKQLDEAIAKVRAE